MDDGKVQNMINCQETLTVRHFRPVALFLPYTHLEPGDPIGRRSQTQGLILRQRKTVESRIQSYCCIEIDLY
jgi:hypothetical protein